MDSGTIFLPFEFWPVTSCVTLGKLPTILCPHFSHPGNEGNNNTSAKDYGEHKVVFVKHRARPERPKHRIIMFLCYVDVSGHLGAFHLLQKAVCVWRSENYEAENSAQESI